MAASRGALPFLLCFQYNVLEGRLCIHPMILMAGELQEQPYIPAVLPSLDVMMGKNK